MRMRLALAIGLTAAAAVEPAHAQEGPRRPEAAQRVVRVFDFEQRDETDIRVPLYWHAAQHNPPQRERPGFPIWNRPALDYSVAAEGEGSVRLPVRGGSVSLRVQDGVLPAMPDADYRVNARVLTRELEHARARLTARFLDQDRRPIPGTEAATPLAAPAESWQHLELPMRGRSDEVAFLQIDLEVLQPEAYSSGPDDGSVIHKQDHDGAAWFDEVRVIQLARTELSSDAPLSVFLAPDEPKLTAIVRDMTGESLSGELEVRDVDGTLVDSTRLDVRAGNIHETWRPQIERFGWYRARFEVRDGQGRRVGRAARDLAWLPTSSARRTRLALAGDATAGWNATERGGDTGVGLSVGRLEESIIRALAGLLEAGLGETLVIPVWTEQTRAAVGGPILTRTRRLINEAGVQRRRVVLSFDALPASLAEAAGTATNRLIDVLSADSTLWTEQLDPVLERFGQSIDRWRFGRPRRADRPGPTHAPEDIARIRERLGELVPGPETILGDTFGREPRSFSNTRHAYALPPGVHRRAIRDLAASASSGESGRLPQITLDPLDLSRWSPRQAIDALVRTATLTRVAFARQHEGAPARPELILHEPWQWLGARAPGPSPRPELAAWRTFADVIAPRRFIEELDAGPHARAFLFGNDERDERGAIVAWSERRAGSSRLDLLLADGPVPRVDVFGNRSPLESARVGPHDRRTHRADLTPTPVYLEGVDVPLVLYQTRARFEPARIPAANRTVDVELLVENPWNAAMAARRFVLEPAEDPSDGPEGGGARGAWAIEPRAGRLAAEPGGTTSFPMTISISPAERTGEHRFRILTELESAHEYGRVFLSPSLEVGTPSIRFEALPVRTIAAEPGGSGGGLAVELVVANAGEETIGVEIDAYAGQIGRSSSIGSIPPDGQGRRRLLFPRAMERGVSEVFISLRDTATGERVNRVVPIP